MVVFIGIEGAAGNANNPATGYTGSFIHELVTRWPDQPVAKYIPGPFKTVGGIENVAQRAYSHACHLYQQKGVRGIIIAGYSRGGAAAIRLCQLLQTHAIQVDCLALSDAIDLDPTVGTRIPQNVLKTVHVIRDPASKSRPRWGNCGTSAPNKFFLTRMKLTHWGASGVPVHQGIPAGTSPNTLVEEQEVVPPYRTYQTAVTWKNEILFGQGLKAYLQSHINGTYLQLMGNSKKPNQTYTVAQGDSLSLIAGRFWSDVLLWPILYDQNKGIIGASPNLIRPGQSLVVPDISAYTPPQLEAVRQRGRVW